MEKDNKNVENDRLDNPYQDKNASSTAKSHQDDSASLNNRKGTDDLQNEDNDKYLAMEQTGITYTKEHNPTANSDNLNPYESNKSDEWSEEGGNSKYSDAFNQDDYILSDNLDLDEDQNKSISSDDDDFEETNERY